MYNNAVQSKTEDVIVLKRNQFPYHIRVNIKINLTLGTFVPNLTDGREIQLRGIEPTTIDPSPSFN